MSETADTWVEIGQLGRPHGVKGELKLHLFNPQSQALKVGGRLSLKLSNGKSEEFQLQALRGQAEQRIVQLGSVENREGAKALVGAMVRLRASQLPAPAEGEFYHYQLRGFAVVDQQDKACGRVRDVAGGKGHDLLVIDGEQGQEGLVPFVDEFILAVEFEKGRIQIKDDPSWWSASTEDQRNRQTDED